MESDTLLARAHQFDPQALAELHDQLYPQVYRYIAYRLDDPQVCEDISSEVFLRLLDVLKKQAQTIQSARAWLLGTANHLVMDFYRRKYRRNVEQLDGHDDIPDHHSPEGEAESRLIQQEVREAMLNLTVDQQHVIALRFSQELSLDETAQLMSKTVNAVKVLQYRALAALRRQLERRMMVE
jgi:RNA polymerase sigma-70 factor (ECF subfamily)